MGRLKGWPKGDPRVAQCPAKGTQIIQAARDVFLRDGFDGASMDAIAETAGVSKMTVYRHFETKEALFVEAMSTLCGDITGTDAGDSLAPEPDSAVSPEGALRCFARAYVSGMMKPQMLALQRAVVAEAARFPELGRLFYECGPLRSRNAVAAILRRHLSDPDQADIRAQAFIRSIQGEAWLRIVLG